MREERERVRERERASERARERDRRVWRERERGRREEKREECPSSKEGSAGSGARGRTSSTIIRRLRACRTNRKRRKEREREVFSSTALHLFAAFPCVLSTRRNDSPRISSSLPASLPSFLWIQVRKRSGTVVSLANEIGK